MSFLYKIYIDSISFQSIPPHQISSPAGSQQAQVLPGAAAQIPPAAPQIQQPQPPLPPKI